MEATSSITHSTKVVGSGASETFDCFITVGVSEGDSYEALRAEFHRQIDVQFNALFKLELPRMVSRVEEGRRWMQSALFDTYIGDEKLLIQEQVVA